MTRFVRAPDVSDVSELFGAPGDFFFKKSLLGKIRFHARDETIYVQNLRCKTVSSLLAWRSELDAHLDNTTTVLDPNRASSPPDPKSHRTRP